MNFTFSNFYFKTLIKFASVHMYQTDICLAINKIWLFASKFKDFVDYTILEFEVTTNFCQSSCLKRSIDNVQIKRVM